MQYNDNGTMSVRTYTAGGALPVKNSVIKIIGADENNRFIEFSFLTDEDGVTNTLILPAPSKSYSLAPGALEVPYAVYDIEASADGYYTKRINNVAIFSGTNTSLPINMIPLSIAGKDAAYPRGNLDATVNENEMLEL
ncbi:MAG: hypothetical protein IJ515_02060 [Clostridia bacterium]|nr:hypothetical protein [Clostridia bacterium]